ncbi:YbaB/EbfC family nucleoid-associated protein [Bartonella ancashensis]|uniref:Nucleoid-associated protein PU02_0597 n=1 Tax=Bartonella ancashensis TaxID=1318743 RepID=A0A0M3T2T6_9HYPH|nr:YbaB/EbfC family nucleoid-associated protein [Bartonella ancashensis]ALE03411.1 hypothetical protein PU02_0597 [Bartonella ancashensis]
MFDMMNMMRKAKDVQEKMQNFKNEMANLQATGAAGGGLVSITMNGNYVISAIRVDPSLIKPEDVGILEDLLMAAYNETRAKVENLIEEKARSIKSDLPIPRNLKLPF